MKRMALLLAVAVILSGCTPGLFPRAKPEPIATIASCPQPKPYPSAFQKQAAQELREYGPKMPATATMIGDYKSLRGALMDCGAEAAP